VNSTPTSPASSSKPSSHPTKSAFAFILAYFHALVQERRTYIPQGWSKGYEFSYSDLKVALEIIENIMREHEATKAINFELLYGIFEEGIYGGRIDNQSDLKVLRAYLRKYFNLLTLNSESQVGFGAAIPKNQKELTAFLAKMPEIDDPSIFGLPRNIDKAVQRTATECVLGSLKTLSLAREEGSALNKEEELKLLSPILKLWTQTFKQIKDAKFPSIKNAELMSENPVESFIYLEASQALLLAERINRQLDLLDNILQGKGLMTTEIQTVMTRLLTRTLPKEWEEFWAECEDPSDWIRKFGRKLLLVKQWVLKAQSSRVRGEEWDLSELFHPVVFINACKQSASRNRIALDKLTLVTTFEEAKSSENAVKLKGLLLQGCSLHKNLLGPLSQRDEEHEKLPTLFVDFLANPPPLYPSEEEFSLFSSVSRETLLLRLKLGISGEASEKIIAGTALFLRDI
jgi:dynein heavy chain 2, cytosolic